MSRFLALVAAVLCAASVAVSSDAPRVPRPTGKVAVSAQVAGVLDNSVLVLCDTVCGTGVVTRAQDGCSYVWTAGHVIRDFRQPSGVGFRSPLIYRWQDGQEVQINAEVLGCADSRRGEPDVALLRVRGQACAGPGATFYAEDEPPPVGAALYHVGNFKGFAGRMSLSTGLVGFLGRPFKGAEEASEQIYDQTTVTSFPGSSGGGLFLQQDGRCVGLLAKGMGETWNLMVPARVLRAWAQKIGYVHALDTSLPPPR